MGWKRGALGYLEEALLGADTFGPQRPDDSGVGIQCEVEPGHQRNEPELLPREIAAEPATDPSRTCANRRCGGRRRDWAAPSYSGN